MSVFRGVRCITATLAVVAFVLVGFLPAQHLHAASTTSSSKPVVHWHIIDEGSLRDDHATVASHGDHLHGDHLTAKFLTPVFDRTQVTAAEQPTFVTAAIAIAPDVKFAWRPIMGENLYCESPPPHLLPSRSPPKS